MLKSTTIRNGIQKISLRHWHEFFDLSADHFAKAPAFIYRGQADYMWPLTSTLDRLETRFSKRKNLCGGTPPFFECPPFNEKQQLNAFKRAVLGRRGPNPPALSDDEYWTLGQHHGLATPLLDWTRSPFVALFFAFAEDQRVEGSNWSQPEFRGVYALSTSTIGAGSEQGDETLKLQVSDSDGNYRLISQAALFVRIPRHCDVEACVAKQFADDCLRPTFVKIKIPNEDRDGCLVALNKMNINYMTLFPDIAGAGMHVNSLWQPGHEDSIAYL